MNKCRKAVWKWEGPVSASSILQNQVVHPWSVPLVATWFVPTQYLNPGAWRLCCSCTENRCNPGSSSDTESEERGGENTPTNKKTKKTNLCFRHRFEPGDTCSRRSKNTRKILGCQSRCCFKSVCGAVCCHSLSSTVPAGEGASAVPGLVSCPSIPQELRPGHCDRRGDCENRRKQTDRGTVTHDD